MKKNNVSDIKRQVDAIKLEFYEFWDRHPPKPLPNDANHMNDLKKLDFEIQKDFYNFTKKSEQKIDELLGKIKSGDELYRNVVLIKGFFIARGLFGLKLTDMGKFIRIAEPIIEKYLPLLEPYKKSFEGVWLFRAIQVVLSDALLFKYNGVNVNTLNAAAKVTIGKAMQSMEEASENLLACENSENKKPWKIDDIFCLYDDKGKQRTNQVSVNFEKSFDAGANINLGGLALMLMDQNKIMKYGVPALEGYLIRATNHKGFHIMVKFARHVVQSFNEIRHYKQSQHIAAVMMHRVVEFRQSLPEKERSTVNPIQYDASFLYVSIGSSLMRSYGLATIFQDMHLHNDEYVRLMPKSLILSQYEKQFPTKKSTDKSVMERINNKSIQWIERMEYLERSNTAPPDLCFQPYFEMKGMVSILKAGAEWLDEENRNS